MQGTPLRTAFFIGLLLSMSGPMKAAALKAAAGNITPGRQSVALGNSALQGSYFFALQRINTSLFGFLFTTAAGTLEFDQNGKVAVQGFINRNSILQPLSATGTYHLDSSGTLQVSIPAVPLEVSGSVSVNLSSLIASNAGSGTWQRQEILLATQKPLPPFSPALLEGKYFLAERTITASVFTPRFESAAGTIDFDGQGSCTLELSSNRDGSVFPLNASGTYQVTLDGLVLLNLPGRSDPVTMGFTPDGGLGVGATLSRNTHDLFAITKAPADPGGNAAPNGSFHLIVSAFNFNASAGFSTAAGQADYIGDGKVFYRLAGMPGTEPAESTVSVDAAGGLQFGGLPNVAGFFQGGLGSSGDSLVAASLNDPSRYNLFVAIRSASQPAAVTNAASFSLSAALSPGGLFSLFGRNLARQTVWAPAFPLPLQLAGTTVRIGGREAPLLFVSPFQINAQVPFELPPSPVSITVVLDGVESGPLEATVNPTSPGIFTLSQNGSGTGIFQHASDYSLVSESNPARPKEVVLIYATGLGAVVPEVPSGAAVPMDTISRAVSLVSVQIDGKDSEVIFAGLTRGYAGLYQINARVPAEITSAGNVPVVVTAAGVSSNPVTLAVSP